MIAELNPIIFSLGKFEIRWYSLFILLAAVFVLFLAEKEAQRFNVKQDFIFNTLFWAFIFGIIGARLYYVLFNLSSYASNPMKIFHIWEGGLAIHGGLIFALCTVVIYTKKYKIRTLRILDFISVPLLLGQAIGRWGNFFNGEAFGPITSAEVLRKLFIPEFIIKGVTIDGAVRVPTFLFESILCLFALIAILFIRRGKYIKVGTPTACYLIFYGVIRFFIEFYREDALTLGPALRIAQVISLFMIFIGIGMLMYISRKGRFEDLYNDNKNIDEIRY